MKKQYIIPQIETVEVVINLADDFANNVSIDSLPTGDDIFEQ